MKTSITKFILINLLIVLFVSSFSPVVSAQELDAYTQSYINAYKSHILKYNPNLSNKELDQVVLSILYYCRQYGVEPRFVVAVVACESSFNIHATSCCGAQGLGQIMPGTAQDWGVNNAYNPVDNIKGTVQILQYNLQYFSNHGVEQQCKLALAAYNAGLGAVQEYGGVPPYAETQNYVVIVYDLYKELCGVR